jgi:YggT family protein
MAPVGNSMLEGLASILQLGLNIYILIVIVRALISWVNPSPHNQVVQFLSRVTDPVLYQIRRRIPVFFGGIDLSPIILILSLIFLNEFLVGSLKALGSGQSVDVILPLFFDSLIYIVKALLSFYMIVLIARAVISWISPDPYNPIVVLIYGITEPILGRLRRTFPLVYSGIDFSPMVVIAAIFLFMRILG